MPPTREAVKLIKKQSALRFKIFEKMEAISLYQLNAQQQTSKSRWQIFD